MIENPLKLEFDGILTKRADKNNDVRAFQIKVIEHGELVRLARDIEAWANRHCATELQNLATIIAATDNPWDKMSMSMSPYDMYFKVDHGHEIYSDNPGIIYDAKLTQINWTCKDDELSAVITLLKNGGPEDDTIVRSYLNYKEEDENGKMKAKPLPIILEQIDSFVLGNAAPNESSDDDEDSRLAKVYQDITDVYPAK